MLRPMSPPRKTSIVVLLLGAVLAAAGATGDEAAAQPGVLIEVNRPHSIFECDTPIGVDWYGSSDRCLMELCAGRNVTNSHILDERGRLRRNPCQGRDPFELSR